MPAFIRNDNGLAIGVGLEIGVGDSVGGCIRKSQGVFHEDIVVIKWCDRKRMEIM
jgi:hypothetical protein